MVCNIILFETTQASRDIVILSPSFITGVIYTPFELEKTKIIFNRRGTYQTMRNGEFSVHATSCKMLQKMSKRGETRWMARGADTTNDYTQHYKQQHSLLYDLHTKHRHSTSQRQFVITERIA